VNSEICDVSDAASVDEVSELVCVW
jgi:hypothetical protein